jgi:hypothetical protein
MRRAHHKNNIQIPPASPNFPHPPPNPLTSLLSQPRETDEDMISNPSDNNFDCPRALPLPPSSRPASSRLSIHDPIRSHSRAPSSTIVPTFQMYFPPNPSAHSQAYRGTQPTCKTVRLWGSRPDFRFLPSRDVRPPAQHPPATHVSQLPWRSVIAAGPRSASPSTPVRQSLDPIHSPSRYHRTYPSSPSHSHPRPHPHNPPRHHMPPWMQNRYGHNRVARSANAAARWVPSQPRTRAETAGL